MAKADELYIKITAKDATAQGVGTAERKLNSLGGSAKRVMGLMAGAFAVERLAAYTVEMAKLGGEVTGVETAFEKMGGTDEYLERLKVATAGTVSELNLMKRAVQANNFDIPLSSLASLFEFATKRAQDTGESVDFLVNSIIMGIGRKSPLILDNLGISAVALRKRLKGVGTEAATVGDIAAVVGDIASEAMEKSGKILDENNIKVQSITAMWADFKAQIATNKAVIESLGDSLNKTQQMMAVWNSEYATTVEKWAISVELFDKRAEAIYNNVMKREKEMQRLRAMTSTELQNELKKQETSYEQLAMAQGGSYVGLGKEANELARIKRIIGEIIAERQKNINHIYEESNEYRNQEQQEYYDNYLKDVVTVGERIVELNGKVKAFQKIVNDPNVSFEAAQEAFKEAEKLKKELKELKQILAFSTSRPDAPAKMQSIGTPDFGHWRAGVTVQTLLGSDEDMEKATTQAQEKLRVMYAEIQAEVDRLNAELSMAMANGFAAGLESAFNGSGIEGILGAFLSPIANFLIQEGTLLVAHGLALEAFKSSLESLNGYAAIAAGAAMIATGAAFKSFVGGGMSGGSGSAYSGGGNGYTNYQPRAQANNSLNVVVSGKLVAEGKDMVWNADKNSYIINRTIGS